MVPSPPLASVGIYARSASQGGDLFGFTPSEHDRRRLTFQTPHFQRACLVNHSPFMAEPQYRQVRGISEMKGAGTLEEMEHHPQVKRLPCPANALPRPPAFQFVMPEAGSCPAP